MKVIFLKATHPAETSIRLGEEDYYKVETVSAAEIPELAEERRRVSKEELLERAIFYLDDVIRHLEEKKENLNIRVVLIRLKAVRSFLKEAKDKEESQMQTVSLRKQLSPEVEEGTEEQHEEYREKLKQFSRLIVELRSAVRVAKMKVGSIQELLDVIDTDFLRKNLARNPVELGEKAEEIMNVVEWIELDNLSRLLFDIFYRGVNQFRVGKSALRQIAENLTEEERRKMVSLAEIFPFKPQAGEQTA